MKQHFVAQGSLNFAEWPRVDWMVLAQKKIMARHACTELHNATTAGSIKRAKPRVLSKKDLQIVTRTRNRAVWPEHDLIDCDVHFDLEVHYLGYLYATARSGG